MSRISSSGTISGSHPILRFHSRFLLYPPAARSPFPGCGACCRLPPWRRRLPCFLPSACGTLRAASRIRSALPPVGGTEAFSLPPALRLFSGIPLPAPCPSSRFPLYFPGFPHPSAVRAESASGRSVSHPFFPSPGFPNVPAHLHPSLERILPSAARCRIPRLQDGFSGMDA